MRTATVGVQRERAFEQRGRSGGIGEQGAAVLDGACYLVDTLAAFLVPDVGQAIHALIVIPCALAELWTVGYLLVIGVRTARPAVVERLLISANGPPRAAQDGRRRGAGRRRP